MVNLCLSQNRLHSEAGLLTTTKNWQLFIWTQATFAEEVLMRKISPKSSHRQEDGHQSKGLNRQKDKRQRNASKLRLEIELEVILDNTN